MQNINIIRHDNDVNSGHSLSHLNIILWEALNEWRRSIRMPMFAIPSLLFPWMFYLFFGVIFNKAGTQGAHYLLVSYACFGVIGPALFGFGISVAVDRDRGLLALKRAVAMPISAYFSAKIIMSLAFAVIIISGFYSIATFVADISLPLSTWLLLSISLLLGTLPFCAMGLAIGCWVNAQAAPAVINLLYLPMSFISGLWIPIHLLPDWLQKIAWCLPPYHFSQLALKVVNQSQMHHWIIHLSILTIYSLAFLLLARMGFRRLNGK